MAGLTKTYSGDLTEFIAGKIWNVIKEIDEEKKIEESESSKEVKDAAKKLLKDDKDSIPVKDKDLRDTVSNIFIPLETKLSKTKSTVDGMSAKITAVGGGIADTQKLIINQNQILEDKFDLMLKIIGNENALATLADEQSKYEQLELGIDAVSDVADTFGLTSTASGKGGHNFLKTLLIDLPREILETKGSWPRKVRAKIMGRVIKHLPTRWVARALGIPIDKVIHKETFGRTIAKKYAPGGISPTMKHVLKQTKPIHSATGEVFKPTLLPRLSHQLGGPSKKYVQEGIRSTGSALPGLDNIWGKKNLGSEALIDAMFGMPSEQALEKAGVLGGARSLKKASVERSVKRKALKEAGANFGTRLQGSILRDIFQSPHATKRLTQKLGPRGVQEIGEKVAKGGFKSGAPILGTAYGAVEGIARLLMGDPKGMLLSFGSAIPIAGWGFTIIDILRDIDRDAYEKHIEPNMPMVSDDDFARFFIDAVGLTPDMYERGTGHVNPTSFGMGGSIQEIVGATLAIGKAAGVDTKSLVTEAGLGSVKPKGTYDFDLNPTGGGKTIATQTKMIEDRELPKIRKLKEDNKGDNGNGDDKGDNKEEKRRNFVGADHSREGYENQGWDFWDWMPDDWFNKKSGEGGVGGLNNMLTAQNTGVKIDASGESGVDFTPDGPDNRAVFDGYVSDIGHQYNPNVMGGDGRMGAGYGHYIGITSVDSKTGQEFEGLYAHFPEGELDRWKIGDTVKYGDVLGRMGTWSDYANPSTRWHVGSGTGPHTSLDFFVPGTNQPYPHWRSLVPRIDPTFSPKSDLLPPPLPPIDSNISAISNPRTNLVTEGSSEHLMTKRQSSASNPIVMVNNLGVAANTTPIVFGSSSNVGLTVKDIQYARLAG